MSYSKADPIQIARMTFDEANEATRVIMLPTEMSMELSAEDGDSILTQSSMQVHSLEAGESIDTHDIRRIACYPQSQVLVKIGDALFDIGFVGSTPVEICAPAINVVSACTVVVQS